MAVVSAGADGCSSPGSRLRVAVDQWDEKMASLECSAGLFIVRRRVRLPRIRRCISRASRLFGPYGRRPSDHGARMTLYVMHRRSSSPRLLGMPLAFALGFGAVVGIFTSDIDSNMLPTRMMNAVNAFPLMSIPFFILAGELMMKAGIIERLIDLANAVVGRVRGGLAHVTMLAGLGLSTVSGAAVADASALGGTLHAVAAQGLRRRLRGRRDRGGRQSRADHSALRRDDRLCLHGRADGLGRRHVHGRRRAGLILVAVMMAMCSGYRHQAQLPDSPARPSRCRACCTSCKRSFVILLMPVVVIGGIVGGVFTATEGSAIAVVYALIIGFFVTRRLKLADLPEALVQHRDHVGRGRRDDRVRLGRHLHADHRPVAA